jgi:hypothetical protein
MDRHVKTSILIGIISVALLLGLFPVLVARNQDAAQRVPQDLATFLASLPPAKPEDFVITKAERQQNWLLGDWQSIMIWNGRAEKSVLQFGHNGQLKVFFFHAVGGDNPVTYLGHGSWKFDGKNIELAYTSSEDKKARYQKLTLKESSPISFLVLLNDTREPRRYMYQEIAK